MTILGMTFEQAAASFGWGELISFSRHLPEGSATVRAKHPDLFRYGTGLQHSAILADIADMVSLFMYSFARSRGAHVKPPAPYPRPWECGGDGAQKVGSDPIPISDFKAWYYGGD